MGVDEIYLGKRQKFLTVVTNLETGERLWFGRSGRNRRWTSFSSSSWVPFNETRFERPVSTCGNRSGKPATVGTPVPHRDHRFNILQHAG